MQNDAVQFMTAKVYSSIVWPNPSQFALNALAIANQSSWEEEFPALIEQAHKLKRLPDDMKCVYAMLEAKGFVRQPGVKEKLTANEFVKRMCISGTDGMIAIVQLDYSDWFETILPNNLTKFGPVPSDGKRFHRYGYAETEYLEVKDVWYRWPDGLDHSPVKRRKVRRAPKTPVIPPDHEAFHYLQKNPNGEMIGDCVVRALAAALDLSWDDALDRLAACSDGVRTELNISTFFRRTLREAGMRYMGPVLVDGRKLRGRDFCRELDKLLHNGERVFAFADKDRHAVAILPFSEGGVTRYKIVDNWDSSSEWIEEYWIK